MFLKYWKLVKSKEIAKKTCAQSDVSAMSATLRGHEDEKENIWLFQFEMIGEKLQDSCSLAYNFSYGKLILMLTARWLSFKSCLIIWIPTASCL